MEITLTFHAPDRSTWRAWLNENHASTREVWLIYYKAHTGRKSIPYEDSVEEALCFGWVDSLIQKLDEDRYARKFTPRRMDSAWSDTNKRRVAKMVRERRMTPAGLAKVTFPLDAPPPEPAKKEPVLPDWISDALQSHPKAWQKFCQLPPSQKKLYINWLSSGKKQETRLRHLEKAIQMLEQNLRLDINTRIGS